MDAELEAIFLKSGSFLLAFVGYYLLLKPENAARAIQNFYANYPLMRHAGKKQLKPRPGFVRVFGIILAICAFIANISI